MKCLIFDCDGVLVDSEIITTQYFIKYLDEIGYKISVEEAIKRFTGVADTRVYREISDETGIIFTPELINQIQTQVHAGLHTELLPISGMSHLIEVVKKNITKSICIASSGTFAKINRSLTVTNLIKYFNRNNIFSVQNVKVGKPAPDLFLFAAKKMQFAPSDCIVIEDSTVGIEAALTAKMSVIGFLGGSHAQYSWYQRKIKDYKIPIACNSTELLNILTTLAI